MIKTDLIAPLAQLIRQQAQVYGDKMAYRDAASAVSYRDLAETTANLAGHLQEMGVQPGYSVAILLPNSVPWVESCFAIARAGAMVVPISYVATDSEIAYRLQDADCRVVITTDECVARLNRMQAELPNLGDLILVDRGVTTGEGLRYAKLRQTQPTAQPRDPAALDEPRFIVYTSGTTGKPKGVILTERSLLWVTAACWASIAGLCEDDYVLSLLPLFHSYALDFSVVSILATGASEYLMEKYSPTEAYRLLSSGEFTVMPGVPTMFQYLMEVTKDQPRVDTGRLRLCLSAGAIMPGTVNQAFEERFGVKLLDGYGITETSTMVTLNWPVGGRIMGSCGLPLPGLAVRLVDPSSGKDVAQGEEGELIVRGPNVMQGYLNKPDETAKALRNGWYHTGDLAKSDPNGFLTITGRLKELIIRGGQNIAPAEVEEVVATFAGVMDAAVVGVPHEHLGEVPVACVIPSDGAEVDVEALLAHCAAALSSYKVPYRVHIVDVIPRTGSGKVIRYKLREALGQTDEAP